MSKIWTSNKGLIDPLNLDEEDICIEDIANSLSKQCRYLGHTKEDLFYSVAEHSLIVSSFCAPEFKLEGLLHDAAEAYISDIPAPIKNSKQFKQIFSLLENNILNIINSKFKLKTTFNKEIYDIDISVVKTEVIQLFENPDLSKFTTPTINLDFNINLYSIKETKEKFIAEFYRLYNKRV